MSLTKTEKNVEVEGGEKTETVKNSKKAETTFQIMIYCAEQFCILKADCAKQQNDFKNTIKCGKKFLKLRYNASQ